MNKECELERQEKQKQQKQIILNLKQRLSELDDVQNMQDLKDWHMSLISFVCGFINSESKQYHYISRNRIFDGGFAFGGSFQEEKKNAKTILSSLINSVTISGIPKYNLENGISVNNSTTVNQTQTNNIDVSLIVREEIGNSRIRELEELVKKEKTRELKFKAVVKALKDFGVETLSSTLAKVILPYLT